MGGETPNIRSKMTDFFKVTKTLFFVTHCHYWPIILNFFYPFHKKSAENVKREIFKIEIMFDLVYIETQTKRNELGKQKYKIKTMREGGER